MLDKKIVDAISTDQFKAFVIEQIKRAIKNGYKSHLKSLDNLHQRQLQIIYENQSSLSPQQIQDVTLLNNVTYSEYRKSILDIGNNTSREIENLFDNLIIGINNKEEL